MTKQTKCWRCRGDGYYFRVPDGFNPFYAGAIQTAAVSERVDCYPCKGTGNASPATSEDLGICIASAMTGGKHCVDRCENPQDCTAQPITRVRETAK